MARSLNPQLRATEGTVSAAQNEASKQPQRAQASDPAAERGPERCAGVDALDVHRGPPLPSSPARSVVAVARGSGAVTGATLPASSDTRQDALGPAGQLVAPWSPGAQLGLDGRFYASSPASSPATETPPGSSLQLGPLHGVSGPDGAGVEQLVPQLDLWAQYETARRLLRCRCLGGEFLERVLPDGTIERELNPVHVENVRRGVCMNRCAKCGLVPRVKVDDIPLSRSERGAFRFENVVICDHWTCPSCGRRYAREVESILGCAIHTWLAGDDAFYKTGREMDAPRDVLLFTPTIPHRASDAPEDTIAKLYATWEHFAASRAWRAWGRSVGLRARTRAFDVTFGGKNGTHPHFHVALFVEGMPGHRWAAAMARAAGVDGDLHVPVDLVDAWLRAARAAGVDVDDEHSFRDFALQLQGGDAAAGYFTKWGLSSEAGASAIKQGGPFELLALAGAGDVVAGEKYRAFCLSVNGRQVVSGLRDTMRAVGISDDDVERYREERQAFLDAQNPPVLVRPLALVVRRALWRRAVTVGFGAVVAEVERADRAGDDVQAALDAFLWSIVPRSSAS